MTLEQQLCKYIVTTYLPGEDLANLQPDDDLLDSGILDSLAIMQLVTHLEQEYRIHIPTEEIEPENFVSVKALASYVQRALERN